MVNDGNTKYVHKPPSKRKQLKSKILSTSGMSLGQQNRDKEFGKWDESQGEFADHDSIRVVSGMQNNNIGS